ncbi:hypothetical protein J2T22_004204 [Pseudarthrobacter defluvii]|uniref:Uncharacterized protein n=1 Tax=Pseudarthrobacter defluvii TaxID=410837 RepID=A0ABT9UMW0_9MICC|nr:hypothetical protein [Pseudarthrobacter defluvii]
MLTLADQSSGCRLPWAAASDPQGTAQSLVDENAIIGFYF